VWILDVTLYGVVYTPWVGRRGGRHSGNNKKKNTSTSNRKLDTDADRIHERYLFIFLPRKIFNFRIFSTLNDGGKLILRTVVEMPYVPVAETRLNILDDAPALFRSREPRGANKGLSGNAPDDPPSCPPARKPELRRRYWKA